MKKQKNIIIKGGYVPTSLHGEELQRFLSERKRGVGAHKSKRDYRRKEKHSKRNFGY